MGKRKIPDARHLDWAEFQGSMPSEGVCYPTGEAKQSLIIRLRSGFRKAGVKQVA